MSPGTHRMIVDFMAADPGLLPADQWGRVVAAIVSAGYEIGKSDASSEAPDLGAVYKRVEPKVLALLASCAPKGTAVTPEILDKARAGIVEILAAELVLVGLTPTAAHMVAGFMGAAVGMRK